MKKIVLLLTIVVLSSAGAAFGQGNTLPVFTRMEHDAAEQALRVLRSSAPDVARAFAYLILRERDLRAVRAVLRGRLLGLAEADIRQALQRAPAEVM